MMNSKLVTKQDISFLREANIKNKLTPPDELSEDLFSKIVSETHKDNRWRVGRNTIRSEIYSLYLWGEVGNIPESVELYE